MMSADLVRRFVYALLVLGMVADLWIVTWANQLDAQARFGYMPPVRPAVVDSQDP